MELILIANTFLTVAVFSQRELKHAYPSPPKYVQQYAYVLGDLSENDSALRIYNEQQKSL